MNAKQQYFISCIMMLSVFTLFLIILLKTPEVLHMPNPQEEEFSSELTLKAGNNNAPDGKILTQKDIFSPLRGNADINATSVVKNEIDSSSLKLLGVFFYGNLSGAIIDGVHARPGDKSKPVRFFKIGSVINDTWLLTSIKDDSVILSNSDSKISLTIEKHQNKNKQKSTREN